ncbi:hypothetical protein C0993_006315 [Termitomyces sp. T159_Od127]|nr:hypothetical protein C0993_006315 [Termitomyces sp. T159_Od127]
MSGLVLTIDDGNPLITYGPAGAWTQHNSSTDTTEAINFHSETWMMTQTPGATISFAFEGVDFVVYGTKSPQNGNYTVDVDGIVGNVLWTGQNTSIQYSVPIYTSRVLPPMAHTITILNKNSGSLSVDYITWNVIVDSNKSGTLSRLVLDDIDPSFNYYGGPWSDLPSHVGNFSDNTGHSTSTLGSAFNLTFSGKDFTIVVMRISFDFHMEGDAISLYGSVGPNNGAYSVQLDAQSAETFVATEPTYVTQTLLYYGNNLGPGNHTLHVINEEDSLFEVDYAEIFTLPNLLSNATSTYVLRFNFACLSPITLHRGSSSESTSPTETTGVRDSQQDGSRHDAQLK